MSVTLVMKALTSESESLHLKKVRSDFPIKSSGRAFSCAQPPKVKVNKS